MKASITRADVFRLLGGAAVASSVASLTACGPNADKSAKLKIGFLTNGPVNDYGYNQAHGRARSALDGALGQQVETQLVENVPETADAGRIIDRMMQNGTRVVVASSFGYQDTVHEIAARNPNVQFLQAWGFKTQPNMGVYSVRMYEAWYVVGIIAGLVSRKARLGVVAAHPIPPMKWQINAFVLGARSVNPEVTASVIFINSWNDATLASQATATLIDQGADVLTGVLDSSVAVAQTAEARGAYVVGHNSDLSPFAPTKILTGTEWLWGGLYTEAAKDVLAGRPLGPKHYSGGLREGYVGYRDFSNLVPEAARAAATAAAQRIRDGQFNVYGGPITDNAGAIRVAAGAALTHDEVMGVDWFVQGVR